jgi:large subunit ribosomal protein L7/L12
LIIKRRKIMAGITKEEIVEGIAKLTVIELSELVKSIEEKFGVKAAAFVSAGGAAAAAAAGGADQAVTEEKTEYDVILSNAGDKKIQVIRDVKAILNLGLKEAKELVESTPKPLKEKVTKKEAEEIKAKLEASGAKVDIK